MKMVYIIRVMEAEKSVESRSSTKEAGKKAELAFKLYDKVLFCPIFIFILCLSPTNCKQVC